MTPIFTALDLLLYTLVMGLGAYCIILERQLARVSLEKTLQLVNKGRDEDVLS